MESLAAQNGVRLSLLSAQPAPGVGPEPIKSWNDPPLWLLPKAASRPFLPLSPLPGMLFPDFSASVNPVFPLDQRERALGHLLHPQTLSLSAQGPGLPTGSCLPLLSHTLAQPAPHASSRNSTFSHLWVFAHAVPLCLECFF